MSKYCPECNSDFSDEFDICVYCESELNMGINPNPKYFKPINLKIIETKIKSNNDQIVQCPKCNSTQIQLMKRGWKIITGFIGSSRNERVCMRCKHKF